MTAFSIPLAQNIVGFGRRCFRQTAGGPGQAPEEHVVQLQAENAYLRLEQQRALSIGRVAERVRGAVAGIESCPAEQEDEAWAVYAEAAVLRETLLAACNDLAVAVSQMQRQLAGTTPPAEMDRRATDRRLGPSLPRQGPAYALPGPLKLAPVGSSVLTTSRALRPAPDAGGAGAAGPGASKADGDLSGVLMPYAERLELTVHEHTDGSNVLVHGRIHPYVAAWMQRQL